MIKYIMSFLDNDVLFYTILFICYANLMADIALGYYVFVILFGLLVVLLSFYISNKTIVLFISLIFINIMILKYDKLTLLRVRDHAGPSKPLSL